MSPPPIRLGLRANLAQFTLLVGVNALVGGMLGQERTVLPLLAADEFDLTGYTFLLTYIVGFGLTKAAANYLAGTWSDRYGRKRVLVAGWLLAVPVPLLLIWAPSWGWVVAANVLLRLVGFFVLIPWLGVLGAAVAATLSLMLTTIALNIVCRRWTGVDPSILVLVRSSR